MGYKQSNIADDRVSQGELVFMGKIGLWVQRVGRVAHLYKHRYGCDGTAWITVLGSQ